MYKNHGKHDQHYLIYKFACFSCNPNCRPCLNHSITNSHSQVQPNGMFHQDWGPSGAPTPVILNLKDPIPFEWPPCLIYCRIQALVYLSYWSQRQTPPHPFPILSRASQECVCNAGFVDFTKDREFPFKWFAWNQCFYRLSMINAGFGIFGQYH